MECFNLTSNLTLSSRSCEYRLRFPFKWNPLCDYSPSPLVFYNQRSKPSTTSTHQHEPNSQVSWIHLLLPLAKPTVYPPLTAAAHCSTLLQQRPIGQRPGRFHFFASSRLLILLLDAPQFRHQLIHNTIADILSLRVTPALFLAEMGRELFNAWDWLFEL